MVADRRAGRLAALALLIAAVPALAASAPRVITLDWTLAETLVALGAPPVGAAQLDAYDKWVGTAALPESVIELGLRTQPNLELLSQLAPDLILLSPQFASLKARLSRIAPVRVVPIYIGDGPQWPDLLAATREVAALVSRPDAGERLIQALGNDLTNQKRRLPDGISPLLVVQLVDARHVRVFGAGSLYAAVLGQLGLASAWTGETNVWGYSLVGLDALMTGRWIRHDARLVVVDPLPPVLGHRLPGHGLWQRLPMVRRGDVIRLPQVWSIGGLLSARRLARQITMALTATGAEGSRVDTASQRTPPDRRPASRRRSPP